ncbi:MAG TPA: hypothetical protein VNC41_03935 [Acidimicrobiia bacterium]|nr:hypothetical protein [Acidimicrobiia bacterium]
MKHERLAVMLPLRIMSVRRWGARVLVGVSYAGRRRHRIAFHFGSPTLAQLHLERVRTWMREGTATAYVRGKGEGALVDLEGLLARAV